MVLHDKCKKGDLGVKKIGDLTSLAAVEPLSLLHNFGGLVDCICVSKVLSSFDFGEEKLLGAAGVSSKVLALRVSTILASSISFLVLPSRWLNMLPDFAGVMLRNDLNFPAGAFELFGGLPNMRCELRGVSWRERRANLRGIVDGVPNLTGVESCSTCWKSCKSDTFDEITCTSSVLIGSSTLSLLSLLKVLSVAGGVLELDEAEDLVDSVGFDAFTDGDAS